MNPGPTGDRRAESSRYGQSAMDQLELEVRQLGGVSFVGFGVRDDALLVEVAADPGAEHSELRSDVQRLAASLFDAPVVVELLGSPPAPPRAERVRLQVTLSAGGAGTVEIHLAYGHRRTVVEVDHDDLVAVARAVVGGLGILGLPTPFGVTAVHAVPPDLGSGIVVLLEDARTGEPRRGLAGGRTTAEATAKAVLNGLNRFLQPATSRASAGVSGAAAG